MSHLSLHFSSLLCCPGSKWVLCLYMNGHCQNQGKKVMKVTSITRTSVCPCVEVMLSCLCTSLYSLFALNDQSRSMQDQCVTDVHQNSKQPQVDNHRSYSELCPYVCDICCTCMYFKSFKNIDFTTMSVCFQSCICIC